MTSEMEDRLDAAYARLLAGSEPRPLAALLDRELEPKSAPEPQLRLFHAPAPKRGLA